MPGEITVRAVDEADAAAFREMRLEALSTHPEAFSSDAAVNAQFPMSYWVERIRTSMEGTRQRVFVAEQWPALVGMAGIFRGDSPKTAHGGTIFGVYVRPAARGQRLGVRLIQACIEWARQAGLSVVKLAVTSGNVAATRLYLECGFVQYGLEPRAMYLDGVYHDEIWMALLL